MSEMPERIWAWLYTGDFNRGEWLGRKSVTTDVEYIRADLATLSSAAVAERESNSDRTFLLRNAVQRVSELEAENARLRDDLDSYKRAATSNEIEFEKLEARLAEAMKALEPFAEIAGEAWADGSGWTNAACQNDRICDWFGPSAFRTARRVREGGKADG